MKVDELHALRERVLDMPGPDWRMDEEIALALCQEHSFHQLKDAPEGTGCTMYRMVEGGGLHSAYRVTASIDAAIGLVREVLPGWWVSTGLCHVSGDCSMGPDHSDPAHRERLLREFPPEAGNPFDGGFHNDLCPGDGPHRVCQAIIVTLFDALIYIAETQEDSQGERAA